MANQVLQDIKDRLNIADVVGGYIQLKKAGVMKGLLTDPSSRLGGTQDDARFIL